MEKRVKSNKQYKQNCVNAIIILNIAVCQLRLQYQNTEKINKHRWTIAHKNPEMQTRKQAVLLKPSAA